MIGVEMLFSEEFLRAARDRLTPGGVYAQWFHLYEVDEETLNTALRTYKEVFGDMAVWFTRDTDILLLGFKDPSPALDIDLLRARFERADFRAGFERAEVGTWIRLLSHETLPLGAVGATDLAGPIHTVRHPILSDSAARAFFAPSPASIPRMPSAAASRAAAGRSLLRREIAGDELSEEVLEEVTRQTCAMAQPIECAAVLARWTVSYPDSLRLAQAARDIRAADRAARQTGGSENFLAPRTIEALAELYRGHPLTAPKSPGPVTNAAFTSHIYASYYHHAFPFDRAALRRAWSICNLRAELACVTPRRLAEENLGPMHSP
jgi:hypothetical protein